MIASFILSWMALAIAGHILTPYIPVISPEPLMSGYLGFYSGVISLGIIPLIVLCWILFWLIWGFKITPKFKRTTKAVWGLTFFIFILTVVFTARNFSNKVQINQDLSAVSIDQEKSLNVVIDRLKEYKDEQGDYNINVGDVFMDGDQMLVGRAISVNFRPSEDTTVYIKRSIFSRGLSKSHARKNAKFPDHEISITDNSIHIPDYYSLNKSAKYRGQYLIYEIFVPEGTVLTFDKYSSIFRAGKYGSTHRYEPESEWKMGKEKLEKV